ncbi:DMT family transporter [Yoonia sp. SS1-5]|uniref:DMT family transporter n=1 Tax=Yoonia rhodophyticola TaxID=3137370 RepID=A0AAN0MBN1_9RHOB
MIRWCRRWLISSLTFSRVDRVMGRGLPQTIAAAIVMMLMANFLFSTVDTSAKWLMGLGASALQMAFLRYAGHFAISLGLFAWRGKAGPALVTDRVALVILRGGLLVVSTLGNFLALSYLPLTITSAIMFSAPIIVAFLSVQLLGEPVGPWRWSAIILGAVGVMIVIQPFGDDFRWAALLSVFNALTLALYSILTRKLAQTVPTPVLQFYTGAIGTLVFAPMAYLVWQPSADPLVWLCWATLGFSGWAGHELLTRAHAIAPASLLMPFSYSFLIYMTVFDVAIFGFLPDLVEIAGIMVIVMSGLVIWYRGRG